MTENMSELEAAIAAGLEVGEADSSAYNWHPVDHPSGNYASPEITTALAALAAYREQVASLQTENARLRDALSWIAENADNVDYGRYEVAQQAAAAITDVASASTADAMKGGEQ